MAVSRVCRDSYSPILPYFNALPWYCFRWQARATRRKERTMELVYMDGKKEPYTLSSIVAECAEIKHRHLKILLNKHREDFESFGKVTFKISPSESGQNVRDYILNEQQATLLITYLRNTEPVKEFKKNLVKAFFEMRDELSKRYLQRELEKPKRKSLTEAIQTWEKAPKHAYSTLTNLLLKGVTGKNKAEGARK